jgi:Sap, sulfolipid-1-addressing protein
MLREGNAWHTFVVGILLSFPGVSYLAALDRLIHLHYHASVTVLIVIGFCLVQNLLLEIPMLAFKIWPTKTPAAIDSAKAWGATHGRKYGAWGLGILGVALAIISVIGLLSG